MSLAKNVDFLRSLSKLNGFQGLEAYGRGFAPAVDSPLVETTGFGSNPGALKMLSFVPEHLRDGAPLVVVPYMPEPAPALAGFTVESNALDNGAITRPCP